MIAMIRVSSYDWREEMKTDYDFLNEFLPMLMGICIALLIMAIAFSFLAVTCEASEFTDDNCIKAAMGEARGEGYQGLLAVCCGIRNRGTLDGVYGFNAEFTEPEWVWDMARKAWTESESNRIHTGDHWGSTICDKDWIAKMRREGYIEVYKHKNHVFYRKDN